MRKAFFNSLGFCFAPCVAGALVISESGNYTELILDQDTTIESGVVINANVLRMAEGIDLNNFGTINAETISIDVPYAIRIENAGEISGNVVLATAVNMNVTQQINNLGEMHAIGNLNTIVGEDDKFYVSVELGDGANVLSFADLMTFANGATEIDITNSSLTVDTTVPQTDVDIVLNNGVSLYMTGIDHEITTPLLTNVVYQSNTFLGTRDIDPMYSVSPYWSGGSLFVNFGRQTLYSQISDTNMGAYFDELRDKNPNDKLLYALDNAVDRDSFNNIISRSVRMNPVEMMQPIKYNNRFFLNDVFWLYDSNFMVRPYYISSSDFYSTGINVNMALHLDDKWVAEIGGFGGYTKYSGELDDFSAANYGVKIGTRYNGNDFFATVRAIMSYAKFKDVYAFDGAHGVNNPTGMALATVADLGPVFHVDEFIKIMPFIGAGVETVNIMDKSESEYRGRIGMDVNTDTKLDDNQYNVGLRAFMESDGRVYGGIYTDMLSFVDGVGGGVDAGIIYDDTGFSYKIALNGKFIF